MGGGGKNVQLKSGSLLFRLQRFVTTSAFKEKASNINALCDFQARLAMSAV
jgi:hypothetical protein